MAMSEPGQTLDDLAKAGWTPAASSAPPAAAKGHDFKILGVNIHVPAEEQPRADSNILTVGGVGVAPEDALMAGQAGRAVVNSARAGGAMAGAVEAAKQAAPIVKYEATKTVLLHMGVPAPIASMIAAGISGYKRGGKAEPVPAPAAAATVPPTAAGAPPPSAAPVAPPGAGPAAPGPPAAPGAPATASPPMPAPPSSGPAPMAPPPAVMTRLSPATAAAVATPIPQKALNEIAIAARRLKVPSSPELDQAAHALMQQGATAQDAVAALRPPAPASAAPTPAPTVAKPKLTGTEMAAFLKLIQQGKTPSEAYAALEAQRAFQSQFGLSTPTADQTRFQKGNRGGRPSL